MRIPLNGRFLWRQGHDFSDDNHCRRANAALLDQVGHRSSVQRIVSWSGQLARRTMATGVSGERPPRNRASLHCRAVVMPM